MLDISMLDNFKILIEQHVINAEKEIFNAPDHTAIVNIRKTYCCMHGILYNLNQRTDEIDDKDHRQFHHLIQRAKTKICFLAESKLESDDA